MLVFTRQHSSTFDPSTRPVVWAQLEGYTDVEDYGSHLYELEVDTSSPAQAFLVSGEEVPSGYTYGLTVCDGKTWVSVSAACIRSCKYVGKMGQVKRPDLDALMDIPLGPTKVVGLGSRRFTFTVCGYTVKVSFRTRLVIIVGANDDQAKTLKRVLSMHLFP